MSMVSDIAALATQQANMKIHAELNTSVLKIAMDTQAQAAAALVDSAGETGQAIAATAEVLPDAVGSVVNTVA